VPFSGKAEIQVPFSGKPANGGKPEMGSILE